MSEATYKILSTGELEILTRIGFKVVPGCSCKGVFEFGDRMAELSELLQSIAEDKPLEALYQEHQRFRYLCDRTLELNGINPDWVRPRDLGWLLFGHRDAAGKLHPSPLQALNAPPQPRHPRKPGDSDGPSDFISILAALAAQCGSIEEAERVAASVQARRVLGALDDIAWNRQSPEEKDDAKFKDWARQQQRKAGIDASGWGAPQQS